MGLTNLFVECLTTETWQVFMRIVQFYVDGNNFCPEDWIEADFEDRQFCVMVHLQECYLPILCFQKSVIPTQWDTHAVHLVGRLCTTHTKMKGCFLKEEGCPVCGDLVKH